MWFFFQKKVWMINWGTDYTEGEKGVNMINFQPHRSFDILFKIMSLVSLLVHISADKIVWIKTEVSNSVHHLWNK